MITYKLNKFLLVLSLFSLSQCYKAPLFDLTIEIINENLEPVPNCFISIEITDVETGDIISGEIINSEYTDVTDSGGIAQFTFENRAFVNARACLTSIDNPVMCKEGHVYLEANENTKLTLMIEEEICEYCF
jgi:hypothetical protein